MRSLANSGWPLLDSGKFAKGYKRGTKVRMLQHASGWLTVEAPQLEIIDEQPSEQVQSRIRGNKHKKQAQGGRPHPRRSRWSSAGSSAMHAHD